MAGTTTGAHVNAPAIPPRAALSAITIPQLLRSRRVSIFGAEEHVRNWVRATLAIVLAFAPLPATAQSPASGGALAERWCMGCHVIEREPRTATADGVPSFPAIAAKPDITAGSIERYLSTAHTHMPDFSLSRSERDALVRYILSFR